ncbi:Gfo/Idh/MocA family protein [Paenibacillus alginolyticus]|uniref:Gfo/Idh/MocA family protein n=1 Tax=Paenibacillus alginolyticus TaxID=59839 RepID=UPI000410977E|nr:Gfo/Idh/MocA family oxidoreductase [Paenibacillus alginolyticus]
MIRVQEVIGQGKVGKPQVLKITSRDPAPPHKEYIENCGGLFIDMSIHDFDMARFIIGSEGRYGHRGCCLPGAWHRHVDNHHELIMTQALK